MIWAPVAIGRISNAKVFGIIPKEVFVLPDANFAMATIINKIKTGIITNMIVADKEFASAPVIPRSLIKLSGICIKILYETGHSERTS